jgi:hypothetical protein
LVRKSTAPVRSASTAVSIAAYPVSRITAVDGEMDLALRSRSIPLILGRLRSVRRMS